MEQHFKDLGEADFRLYKAMQDWHNRIGDMLAYVSDAKLNATESPKLFATEKKSRDSIATNFVSDERDLALRGFVSPLGSRARQTSMSGSLGTLALYATLPIQSIRQSWAFIRKGVDGVNSFSHWPIITDSRHYPKLADSASSTCSRK
jgi:hypothetical protein